MLPRGIRLSNPGNIDKGQPWRGLAEEQPDERFCTFESPEWGIRAMHIILQTYQSKYDLRSISELIGRWAPPTENDTTSYIKHVASVCGVDPALAVDVMQGGFAFNLVKAIIAHENSNYEYPDETLWAALRLAGVQA